MTNTQNSRYKELLDELQLQSWQLELVISGFAIFGLFSALEPLFDWFSVLRDKGLWKTKYLALGIYTACILTIFNLLIHVLLRGLWIGAIGLRSVSGEIDFKTLSFNSLFTSHLHKKIKSFDHYISKLENYSSIMFGITFLVIFMTIGVFINFILLLFITSSIFESYFGENVGFIIKLFLACILSIFWLLTLIDFITRGLLKKIGGKFYLVIYQIASILTLSIIYRPLLYNFWDNNFGKRLIKWLLPFYLFGVLVFSSVYIDTNYFSSSLKSSEHFAAGRNYVDIKNPNSNYRGDAWIQSKKITDNYVELTILYDHYFEELLFEYHPFLRPKKSIVGFRNILSQYFHWSFGDEIKLTDEVEYLNIVNNFTKVSIDSVLIPEKFIVSREENNNTYLKKYIDISNLERGKHLLKIELRISKTDSTKLEHYETIPFWYFKD